MTAGLRIWISTIVAAVLSGVYWLLFFVVAEGVAASDYRAGARPSEAYLTLKVVAVVVIGPLIYAALIALWRRAERAFVGRG